MGEGKKSCQGACSSEDVGILKPTCEGMLCMSCEGSGFRLRTVQLEGDSAKHIQRLEAFSFGSESLQSIGIQVLRFILGFEAGCRNSGLLFKSWFMLHIIAFGAQGFYLMV